MHNAVMPSLAALSESFLGGAMSFGKVVGVGGVSRALFRLVSRPTDSLGR